MFINYSETYSSAITTLAGLIVTIFGISNQADLTLIIGLIVNIVGIAWTITHRKGKGDITPLGFRK